MDDSYFGTPMNPLVSKAVKWLPALLLLRVKRPWLWTLLVSSNIPLRRLFAKVFQAHQKDPKTVNRRINKLANFVTCCLLYMAVANVYSIPKDYILVYIFMAYHGDLNPPSSDLIVSPTTQRFSKIHAYKKYQWFQKLYENKHKIVFPAIFAQILSNYLTPTSYRLNHRYLSGEIKNYILNPIWINFSVTAKALSINWTGLSKSYFTHATFLFVYCALIAAKSSALTMLNSLGCEFRISSDEKGLRRGIIEECKRAITLANFIYLPHMISVVLIGLTSPLFKTRLLRKLYLRNTKQFIKYYIKMIGFAAAFASMLVPVSPFASRLSKPFMDGVNMYLLRVIILSKWRIIKSNHPWFTILRYGTWDRIESLVMCYGVWKLTNLNDYIEANRYGKHAAECERIASSPLLRGVERIIH